MTVRRLVTALAVVLIGILTPILTIGSTAGASPSPTLTYSAQVTIPAPPTSSFSGAAGGGDGWGLAFTSTQVFNVFHHQMYLGVSCHNTSDASLCWAGFTYKRITDGSGNGFATSGQPGLYVNQSTGALYVYATQISDNTAGVVCINTNAAVSVADPFCGFTPLSATGDAPLNGSYALITNPVLVGSDFYAFNSIPGAPAGTKDQMMCFNVSTGAACAGQPYSVAIGGSLANQSPMPTIGLIGGKVIVPVGLTTGNELTCFDPTTDATCAGGSWPVSTPVAFGGGPFPLLNSSGTTIGVCLPVSADPCWNLNGVTVSTPTGLYATTGSSYIWNGPAVVLGTKVYVPNGNAGDVTCYNFATSASCANFPLTFSNLSSLYTVTQDPYIPTCLWVNADSGSSQIQNFDAISGGSCAQAPLRIQASSFVAPSNVCIPASFTSLQVVSPVPSAYTSGNVQFEDANYVAIPGIATHTLDSTGTTNLTDLNLPTTDALPQFVITLNGLTGSPGAVTLNVTWTGSYSPACVTSTASVTTATAPGSPTGVTATGAAGSDNVSWTAPTFDGYSPVTSYDVTAFGPTGNVVGSCVATAPATNCVVTGLSTGILYTFGVVAVNAIGQSPVATGTGYAGLLNPPGPPTAVSATPGNGSVSVVWTAPSNNGGSPLTGYVVTAYDAHNTAVGTCNVSAPTTTCNVGGLTNGQPYTFKVVAVNAIGTSVPGATSTSVLTLAPSVKADHKVLKVAPTYSPVSVTCANTDCLGIANVSVARRVFKGTKQIGWRHLILGRAQFTLKAGQRVTLHMIDTPLGKIVLPRQLHWWLDRRPRFRMTLTTSVVGGATSHYPVFLH